MTDQEFNEFVFTFHLKTHTVQAVSAVGPYFQRKMIEAAATMSNPGRLASLLLALVGFAQAVIESEYLAGDPEKRASLENLLQTLLTSIGKEDRPGWSDYYAARWGVLGRDEDMEKIVRREKEPGAIGESARWMVQSLSEQFPHFRAAHDRILIAAVTPHSAGGSIQ